MAVLPIDRDDYSAPFFDAAARGVLLLRRSPDGAVWAPPTVQAAAGAGADRLEWAESSGEGSVVSWTALPVKGEPGPGTLAGLVELAEGPWLTVQFQGFQPEALRVGAPVRITFETPEGGEPVPVAVPR